MTWAYAGQLLTTLIGSWWLSEIVCSILAARKEAKVARLNELKRKIDRFTHKYGERSEDPDDQAYEA